MERTEIQNPIDACSKLHCIKRCCCRDLSLQPSPLPFFAHVLFFSSCSSSLLNFSTHILAFLLHFALLACFFCFLLEDKVRQYKSRNISFQVHGLSQPTICTPFSHYCCCWLYPRNRLDTLRLERTAFPCLPFLASHTTLSLVSPPHHTTLHRNADRTFPTHYLRRYSTPSAGAIIPMNFFSKSPKKSSKKTSDSDNDDSASSRSRSPTKKSTTPSSSTSKSSKPGREENYKHGQGSSRSSRSFAKANTKTPRHPYDPNTHPLNLPPDQLRRLSARASSNMSDPDRMDVDSEGPNGAPTSPPPQANMPGAFDSPKPNGTPAASNGEGPVPPPHKSNPTSPAAASPPTVEEAEAFKAAGNKFYKAKEYKKAIEEYTKGMLLFSLKCSQNQG